MSRAWVSAIFNSAIKWLGWTTLASIAPGQNVLLHLERQINQNAVNAGADLERIELFLLQLRKADELTTRNNIEDERLDINQKAIESQMAEQQAKVDQMRALAELKQKQLDALKVRAGIDGVLVDLPLQVGQHVLPGAMLAKVVQPNHLIAELKIAETQARDIQIGATVGGRHAQWRGRGNRDASRSRGAERDGHG